MTLLAGRVVTAQPAAPTSAEQLFYDGERLRKEGKIDEACVAYLASYEQAPRGSALLQVSKCNTRRGKHATARSQLLEVIRLATQARRPAAIKEAEGLLAEVEPKVAWVVLRVDATTSRLAGLTVTLDGAPVDSASFGRGVPVDAGRHLLVARAPQHHPLERAFDIGRDGQRVELPPVQLVSSVVVPCSLEGEPYDDGAPVPPGCQVDERFRLGLIIGGAATFGAFWLGSIATAQIATDTDDLDLSNDADFVPMYVPVVGPFITIATADASTVGAVLLIIDGVVQAGGAAMLTAGFLARDKTLVREPWRPAVLPWLTPTTTGLQLRGAL